MQEEKKREPLINTILITAGPAAAGLLLRAAFPGAGFIIAAPLAFMLFFITLYFQKNSFLPGFLFALGLSLSLTPWLLHALAGHFAIHPIPAMALWIIGAGILPTLYFMAWGFFTMKILPAKNSGVGEVYLFALGTAAIFTITEFLRTFLSPEGGWGHLASVYYRHPALLQITRFTGSGFLSFLTVMTGALCAGACLSSGRGARRRAVLLLPPLVIWGALYGAGYRASAEDADKNKKEVTIQAALVHPAINQENRWRRDRHQANLLRYRRMSLKAFSSPRAEGETRILFWPETAVTAGLADNREARETAQEIIQETGAWLLAGSPHRGKDTSLTNGALLFNPEGALVKNYAKVHLLPYAEKALCGKSGGNKDHAPYSSGAGPVLLPVKTAGGVINFAPLICFEAGMAAFTARYRRRGAHVLVNLSNDAWFGNSSESEQQLALLVLRAVETGLPALRVTGYGLSGAIDSFGRIIKLSSVDRAETLSVALQVKVSLTSFYSRFPGWFILFCLVLTVPLLRKILKI